MALVLHVAVVQESDYSALAPLCIRRVVSDNYAGFLANVEDYCKELESKASGPSRHKLTQPPLNPGSGEPAQLVPI